MDSNDARGWVMSAVSGVGTLNSVFEICVFHVFTLFHSLCPRSCRHLRGCGAAAGHARQELSDR